MDLLPTLVPFMGATLLAVTACMGCMWRATGRRMEALETRIGEMLAVQQIQQAPQVQRYVYPQAYPVSIGPVRV